MSPKPLRIEGTLRSWNDERGFGFLESPLAADAFVHISAFEGRPQQGERFSYVIGFAADGRARAEQVRSLRKAARGQARAPRVSGVGLLAIPAFALLLVVLIEHWGLTVYAAAVYGAVSLGTFFVYAIDKAAAKSGSWRVSESTLLGLGFFCGWPGAILGQQLLRHKTIKEDFQRAFWFTVLGNVVVAVGVVGAVHYGLIPV